MPRGEFWRPKFRTLAAMAQLCRSQLLVSWIPFNQWRDTLGCAAPARPPMDRARQLAADVEWAARRLPVATKCLPRAMALSWMLRRRRIGHTLVIAVRPSEMRQSADAMHAWVEIEGERLIGDLPGPWIETLRLGAET